MEPLEEPRRNPFCRHYDDCLTKAAIKGSRELPCHGCEFEHDQYGRPDIEAIERDEANWDVLFHIDGD